MKKAIYKIGNSVSSWDVEGYVASEVWATHRDFNGRWIIDHLPTGAGINACRTRREAEDKIRALESSGYPWGRIKLKNKRLGGMGRRAHEIARKVFAAKGASTAARARART